MHNTQHGIQVVQEDTHQKVDWSAFKDALPSSTITPFFARCSLLYAADPSVVTHPYQLRRFTDTQVVDHLAGLLQSRVSAFIREYPSILITLQRADLVQEGRLKLLEVRHRYQRMLIDDPHAGQRPVKFTTFATKAIDNHLVDVARRQHRYGCIGDTNDAVEVAAAFRNPPSDPGDLLDLIDSIKAVDGSEILAEALGQDVDPSPAARQRRSRTRKALRKLLMA